MSQAPYAVRNVRFGTKFGVDLKVCFSIFSPHFTGKIQLLEVFCKMGISITVLLIFFFQFHLKARGYIVGRVDRPPYQDSYGHHSRKPGREVPAQPGGM